MNRLNIPISGGFPLNNENLRVLAEYAEYFNKIFNALRLPARSCVFLDVPSLNHTNQQIACYLKGTTGNGNIVMLSTGIYSVSDLVQSNNLTINVNIVNFNTVVAGTTYADVRTSETATLATTVNNPWKFLLLEEALKIQLQSPSDSVDFADCNFLVGTNIGFDVNGQITGAVPSDPSIHSFLGTGNTIEKIGIFLKINFIYASAAGGSINTLSKNIIELPTDFVNFSKITKLKTTLIGSNIVDAAFSANYESLIYKNYIIMPTTGGAAQSIIDYVPIV